MFTDSNVCVFVLEKIRKVVFIKREGKIMFECWGQLIDGLMCFSVYLAKAANCFRVSLSLSTLVCSEVEIDTDVALKRKKMENCRNDEKSSCAVQEIGNEGNEGIRREWEKS